MSPDRGLKLASFDGGGLCCLSQLEILCGIMHRLRWDLYPDDHDRVMLPCEHFDLIGGSDAGGLIALMLARLCLPAEAAMSEFATIVDQVYVRNLKPMERTSRLRKCIESLLTRSGFSLDLPLEDRGQGGGCLGFVVTASSFNMASKVHMRTYRAGDEPPLAVTVVEAALATCASPPEFLPVPIGPQFERQHYVGAGMGANNPTRRVLAEATAYFGGERRLSLLVSLGSGHPGVLSLAPGNDSSLFHLIREMILDSEQEAQEIYQRLAQFGVYFRFSVEQGMHRHQTRGGDLGWISAQTSAYLSQPETTSKIDQCVDRMTSIKESVALGQLDPRAGFAPTRRDAQPASTSQNGLALELEKLLRLAEENSRATNACSAQIAPIYHRQDRHSQTQPFQKNGNQGRNQRHENENKLFLLSMQWAALHKHNPTTEPPQFKAKETRMPSQRSHYRG